MNKLESILVYLRDLTRLGEAGALADPGFRRALALARKARARLDVVDVLPPVATGAGGDLGRQALFDRCRTLGRALLEDVVRPYTGGVRVGVDILTGPPALAITAAATNGRYDLVVKTARPEPGSNRPYGDVARRLIRYSPCPVLVVKDQKRRAEGVVLAAIGPLSTAEERALDREVLATAFELAHLEDAEVHVLHAWEPSKRPGLTRCDTAMRIWRFLAEEGIRLHPRMVHLIEGQPEPVVERFCRARNVLSVVVGTFGRVGFERALIGNTAERMLEWGTPDLLAVKGPSFRPLASHLLAADL